MRLNIGCGEKPIPGWTNIDYVATGFQDIVGNIETGLDLPDACASEILLDNVIEHLGSIPAAMREIHRLLRTGGSVTLITPHFTALSSWRDPTHLHHLSYFSFDMFCKERNAHYLGGHRFNIIHKKLSFGGGLMGLIGRTIFLLSPEIYERKFCFIFRASTLTVALEAL